MNVEKIDQIQEKVINSDEIQQHIDTVYICAREACHRIFEFLMHKISHAI